MKKLLLILCSVLCIFPCQAYALENIGYYKYHNTAMIHIDNVSFEEGILIIAQYSQKTLIQTEFCKIEAKQEKFESERIEMKPGIDYKFYVWDNFNGLSPLYNSLTLNTLTADGSNETGDGEYTKPY